MNMLSSSHIFGLITLSASLLVSVVVFGQSSLPEFESSNAVNLRNPSFEDFARAERVPIGWQDCGFAGESAPDTHPSGAFEVIKRPSHGNTYLGMVVRDNDTWERVSQQLNQPIQAGQCYSFSLDLCRSELYVSYSRTTETPANYTRPVKLVIWGGNNYCAKKERLGETPLIKNTAWQTYPFRLEPKQTHTYIMLEAFYETPVLFPYNGNVLVDKASSLEPIACEEEPVLSEKPAVEFINSSSGETATKEPYFTVIAKVAYVEKESDVDLELNGKKVKALTFDKKKGTITARVWDIKKGENRVTVEVQNEAGRASDLLILNYQPAEEEVADIPPPPAPQSYEEPTTVISSPAAPNNRPKSKMEGFGREEIAKGQIIKMSELSFQMNDSTLNVSAHTGLNGLRDFLKDHPEVVIEIGGHTSGLCEDSYCNKLSKGRARAVVEYLKEQGVPARQLTYKGYGKTKPIASNRTIGGRRKNQRVEIKVLSTDG